MMKSIRYGLSTLVLAMAAGTTPAQAAEPFIGEVQMVGFNFAHRGFAFCDGQLQQIAQNPALFSILGTTYGGDGRTTFGLPNLQGRVAMHPGNGPGLTPRRLGELGGTATVSLAASQWPVHSHGVIGSDGAGDDPDPSNRLLAKDGFERQYSTTAPNVNMNSQMLENTGGSEAHNNVQPYLGIYHVIALTGTFPSRS